MSQRKQKTNSAAWVPDEWPAPPVDWSAFNRIVADAGGSVKSRRALCRAAFKLNIITRAELRRIEARVNRRDERLAKQRRGPRD